MTDPIVLKKPITAYGEVIDSIILREPVGRDYIACGYPVIIMAPNDAPTDEYDEADGAPLDAPAGEFRPNVSAIAKLISRLGNIPKGAVENMDGRDFNACLQAVLGFLGEMAPARKTSSMPVSTSPGRGNSIPEASST